MWRDVILALDADAAFRAPAAAAHIRHVEVALGLNLPPELVAFLSESNGVDVSFGTSLVWAAETIAENNVRLRAAWRQGGDMSACMPMDHLLFFGELGNGDLCAFPISAEGVRNQIFVWDHEDDSRRCEANSLHEWLTGNAGNSRRS